MALATKKFLLVIGTTGLGLALGYGVAITPRHSFASESAERLLDKADALSWENRWPEAKPLYAQAANLFHQKSQPTKALYAEVSEIPADESTSIPVSILHLDEALTRPEGQDPRTKLRILTIRGMLEINYDAREASATWREVERIALRQGEVRLASRAGGEQGIAAFVLGDTVTAKNQVIKAWALSQAEHDLAATVRYASIYGVGLVQIHRYKEALTPLDKAISIAKGSPQICLSHHCRLRQDRRLGWTPRICGRA